VKRGEKDGEKEKKKISFGGDLRNESRVMQLDAWSEGRQERGREGTWREGTWRERESGREKKRESNAPVGDFEARPHVLLIRSGRKTIRVRVRLCEDVQAVEMASSADYVGPGSARVVVAVRIHGGVEHRVITFAASKRWVSMKGRRRTASKEGGEEKERGREEGKKRTRCGRAP
jgi:hypothetical protein